MIGMIYNSYGRHLHFISLLLPDVPCVWIPNFQDKVPVGLLN